MKPPAPKSIRELLGAHTSFALDPKSAAADARQIQDFGLPTMAAPPQRKPMEQDAIGPAIAKALKSVKSDAALPEIWSGMIDGGAVVELKYANADHLGARCSLDSDAIRALKGVSVALAEQLEDASPGDPTIAHVCRFALKRA